MKFQSKSDFYTAYSTAVCIFTPVKYTEYVNSLNRMALIDSGFLQTASHTLRLHSTVYSFDHVSFKRFSIL